MIDPARLRTPIVNLARLIARMRRFRTIQGLICSSDFWAAVDEANGIKNDLDALLTAEAPEIGLANICGEGWHRGVQLSPARWRCVVCGFGWYFDPSQPAPLAAAETPEPEPEAVFKSPQPRRVPVTRCQVIDNALIAQLHAMTREQLLDWIAGVQRSKEAKGQPDEGSISVRLQPAESRDVPRLRLRHESVGSALADPLPDALAGVGQVIPLDGAALRARADVTLTCSVNMATGQLVHVFEETARTCRCGDQTRERPQRPDPRATFDALVQQWEIQASRWKASGDSLSGELGLSYAAELRNLVAAQRAEDAALLREVNEQIDLWHAEYVEFPGTPATVRDLVDLLRRLRRRLGGATE